MARLLPLLVCLVFLTPQSLQAEEAPRAWMVVLGTEQFLLGAAAYPAFCKQHAGKDRREVRKATLTELKRRAEAGRSKLLAALGNPTDAKPLWLLNAVVVQLTAAEATAARAHKDILWTYPAGLVPQKLNTEKLAEVLKKRKKRRKFNPKGKTVPWHIGLLKADQVWKELGITGEGVVVASFDHGIHYRHQDIRGNVWRNPDEKPNNGKDDDKNGYVDDLYGFNFARMSPEVLDRSARKHGALTSSCTVGDGTGGTVTGVAPRAKVMALMAMGGPYNAARALQYALDEGADVLNMSFSIPNLGNTRGLWRMFAEHASAAGLAMVSGAGNFQRQAKIPVQIRIPEGIPCVICIGGLNRQLQVPGFVSLGPVEWASVKFFEDHPMPAGLLKPDVCAFPGPGIQMIDPNGKSGYLGEKNGRRGNSLSAPQGAGVIALMLSANPCLNPWEVKRLLEESATDLETKGKDARTGAGLIDALAAVKRAQGAPKGGAVTTR
ncbi:MAG: S8 family serine peptidase [Planctomycetota bacterium]|nr:S8 family serine peptidase [Planctomycetota bacterium]